MLLKAFIKTKQIKKKKKTQTKEKKRKTQGEPKHNLKRTLGVKEVKCE